MNIYLREIRANYKSFLIWAGTMVFLIYAGMMKYSAFAKTGDSVNEIFRSLPQELLLAMGIDPGMDLSSIGAFYSIFFLYFLLLTSVHSCLLGVNILAKEQRDKTADFLLVKPIKRHQAVTAKILAALTFVVLYNLVTLGTSIFAVRPLNDTGLSLDGPILRLSLALLIIQILFLSVGLFLGAWSSQAVRASGLATSVILGTFILKVLIDLNDNLETLEFLTPYRYFSSIDVMFGGEIYWPYILLAVVLAITFTAGAYYFFQKRDILN